MKEKKIGMVSMCVCVCVYMCVFFVLLYDICIVHTKGENNKKDFFFKKKKLKKLKNLNRVPCFCCYVCTIRMYVM